MVTAWVSWGCMVLMKPMITPWFQSLATKASMSPSSVMVSSRPLKSWTIASGSRSSSGSMALR